MDIKEVEIYTEKITLNQFLKWARIVETGGEGKNLILSSKIKVNGAIERRRNRVLKDGDIVEIDNRLYKVVQRK